MQGEESGERCAHREEKRSKGREQRGPERQKRSKAAHGQENRKAQQERGVVEKRSGEPSKC